MSETEAQDFQMEVSPVQFGTQLSSNNKHLSQKWKFGGRFQPTAYGDFIANIIARYARVKLRENDFQTSKIQKIIIISAHWLVPCAEKQPFSPTSNWKSLADETADFCHLALQAEMTGGGSNMAKCTCPAPPAYPFKEFFRAGAVFGAGLGEVRALRGVVGIAGGIWPIEGAGVRSCAPSGAAGRCEAAGMAERGAANPVLAGGIS